METASSSGLSSDLDGGRDPIVARATPAGRSALAVVRVSAPAVGAIAELLCPDLDLDRPWSAQLVAVRNAAGEVLDRAVVVPYRAPRSYTGEDMLEVILHGSSYLVGAVIDVCIVAGARQARPGEFTRRAVANGKMDLVQAEAVQDLVAAETSWQARNARRQLGGELSAQIRSLRDGLVSLLAELEAGLDFGEHGVELDFQRLEEGRWRCLERLDGLLGTAVLGGRIRDGVRVVILGPVNAGKSTLFNHLVGRERAIVSPQPGTTRDLIEAEIEVAGLRVVLVDTAGIGTPSDALELEGVRRARAAAAAAGAAILLWPCGGGEAPVEPDGIEVVRVRSKADLSRDPIEAGWLPVSVHRGTGLEGLVQRLEAVVAAQEAELGDEVAISRRHRRGLERAKDELEDCRFDAAELAAERLRWAVEELGEVIGDVSREAVLDEVFSGFCIGK